MWLGRRSGIVVENVICGGYFREAWVYEVILKNIGPFSLRFANSWQGWRRRSVECINHQQLHNWLSNTRHEARFSHMVPSDSVCFKFQRLWETETGHTWRAIMNYFLSKSIWGQAGLVVWMYNDMIHLQEGVAHFTRSWQWWYKMGGRRHTGRKSITGWDEGNAAQESLITSILQVFTFFLCFQHFLPQLCLQREKKLDGI